MEIIDSEGLGWGKGETMDAVERLAKYFDRE